MRPLPFQPGDTIVRVKHQRLSNIQAVRILPIGSVWTVDYLEPLMWYVDGNVVPDPEGRWGIYLVGVDHPPWICDPRILVGYNPENFRKTVTTDISVLRGLLQPKPVEELV